MVLRIVQKRAPKPALPHTSYKCSLAAGTWKCSQRWSSGLLVSSVFSLIPNYANWCAFMLTKMSCVTVASKLVCL